MTKIEVFEVTGRGTDPVRWDDWARRSGGSIRSTYSHAKAWSIKHRLSHRLRLFELNVEENGFPRKIGQVALGDSRHERVFLDRLQLAGRDAGSWVPAMASILARLGQGSYRYGWDLNLEASREGDLRGIPGVEVMGSWPRVVEAVDFSRWATWDEYYRVISNNIRRNAKKAASEFPDIRIEVRRGLSSLSQVPDLIRLRADMYRRKELGFHAATAAANAAVNIISTPKYVLTALARERENVLAAFSGVAFGAQTYYMDGGSRGENSGSAWYLMLAMLKEAYERDSSGKFVMGYIDPAIHDEAVGGGLLRSRRSCRVTDYDTSIVSFRWTGGTI